MVLGVKDILEELRIEDHPETLPSGPAPKIELNDEEALVLTEITDDPRHVDSLAENLRISPADTLRTLFSLEMKGLVRQMPGKMYVRN